jgi:hypothetical protein
LKAKSQEATDFELGQFFVPPLLFPHVLTAPFIVVFFLNKLFVVVVVEKSTTFLDCWRPRINNFSLRRHPAMKWGF